MGSAPTTIAVTVIGSYMKTFNTEHPCQKELKENQIPLWAWFMVTYSICHFLTIYIGIRDQEYLSDAMSIYFQFLIYATVIAWAVHLTSLIIVVTFIIIFFEKLLGRLSNMWS